MAIIGARPAQPWFLGWRSARRPTRTGSRPGPRPRRMGAGQGVRVRRRAEARRDIRPLLLAIVIAAGMAFFYLSQSTRVAATGYQIDALEASLAELRASSQQLVSAIGNARSPAQITNRARSQLGLVPLDEGAVQFVRGSVTTPPYWPVYYWSAPYGSSIDH